MGELAVAYTGVYAVGITAEGIQLYNDLPLLGDKIEYLFGNATGTLHSIQRSLSMEAALNRIGLFDDPEGRMEVYKALYRAYSLLGNVEANAEGQNVVESMVWGPYGYMGMKSFWEGGKLITAWFFEH
ncbi:hypothetical protein [Butyrivibrio sp. MC2021]|uniref:hypothetical protein n=1 Tax=Butyrivibrio sp. MC2021 TaxID=1408306 RepID=UPI00047C6B5D|nr:hypothetical protein [Butyrivibrio sp. MC2021]